MKDWLAELLQRWFVPRADFEAMRMRLDRELEHAIRRNFDLAVELGAMKREAAHFADLVEAREARWDFKVETYTVKDPGPPDVVTFGAHLKIDNLEIMRCGWETLGPRVVRQIAEKLTENVIRYRQKLHP